MAYTNQDAYVKQPFLGQRNFTQLDGEDRQPQERAVQHLTRPPPIASTRPVYGDSFRGRPFRLERRPHGPSVPSGPSHAGVPSAPRHPRGRLSGPTRQGPFRYRMPHHRPYASGQHSTQPYNADPRREYESISRSHHEAHDLSGNKSQTSAPNLALDPVPPSNAPSTSLSSRYADAKPYDKSGDALGLSRASSSSTAPKSGTDSCIRGPPMQDHVSDAGHKPLVVAPSLPNVRPGIHLKPSLQPPTKRRKTTPTPAREILPQSHSKQKVKVIIGPVPAAEPSRGTLFVAMIDSCRHHPGRDFAQVKENRKRWKSEYVKKLADEGREVEKTYIRDDGMAIDWRLHANDPGIIDLTHSPTTESMASSPTSPNDSRKHSPGLRVPSSIGHLEDGSSSTAPLSRHSVQSSSLDPPADRIRVILPGHTRGNKRLRSAWVLGHIQLLRNQKQPLGLTVKKWYYIKDNTEMVVELCPIPASRAGTQGLNVKQMESKTPAVASMTPMSGAPRTREPETTRYSPSRHIQEDANVVPCFPTPQPSPTSPRLKQEIISDVIFSNNSKSADSGTPGVTDAVDSLPTQNKAQVQPQRPSVKNISPANGGAGNHFPPRALAPSPGLRQSVSTSSLSRIDRGVEEDVGNIMRIVTPTSHQLIALSDGVAGPILISKTYVMNISKGGIIEFVIRSPPRTIVAEWTLPPQQAKGVKSVNDAAMTLDPFEDQAVIAYNDVNMQVSIVDFRSDSTVPNHYFFQQCPHKLSGPQSICTLPSTLASDVGINFVTGGADRDVYHWKYDGQTMKTTRFNISHRAPVQTLAYCKDSARLYTGTDDAVLTAYDVENDAVSACVVAPNPVKHVHAQSPNVMLVEVEDRGMQFQIHDWRAPRIIQRFGYLDNATALIPLKGNVRGHFFARGDALGNIRLWDTRNLDGYQTISICPGYGVSQVLFDSFEVGYDRLISSLEDNRLAFSSFLRSR